MALAAYSNSFQAGLALDSGALVDDVRVHEVSRANLAAIFQEGYYRLSQKSSAGLYRPLVTFSFLFNYSVLGNRKEVLGYHAVNFAFHAANALLLWLLALTIFRSRLAAFFVAAIFALHPVATETVTNISGRADAMAATAVLAGLLLYARGAEASGLRSALVNTGLFLSALAGMLSKENAVVLLALIFLYDLSFHPGRLRKFAAVGGRYLAAAAGVITAALAHRLVLSGLRAPEFAFVDNPILDAGFLTGRLTALGVIVKFWKLLLWPRTLSCDYSYDQIPLASLSAGLSSLAAVLLVLAVVFLSYRWSRAAFFFGMWFFVAVLPTSNLLLVIGSIMAERFAYLPLAGFSGFVVAAVWALESSLASAAPRLRYAPALALGLIACSLGVRTWLRNLDWHSDFTIWSAAAEASPRSFKPHHILAGTLLKSGEPENIASAAQEEERAIAILRKLPPERNASLPYVILGILRQKEGDLLAREEPQKAQAAWQAGVQILHEAESVDRAFNQVRRRRDMERGLPDGQIPDIGNVLLYETLSHLQQRIGRLEDALATAKYAIRLVPEDENLHADIAGLMRTLGRHEDAELWAAESLLLKIRPDELARFQEYYQQLHPNDCPAVSGAPTETLNLGCRTVSGIVCRAHHDLLRQFKDARFPDAALRYQKTSLAASTCPD